MIGIIAVGSATADAPKVISLSTKPMGGTIYYLAAGMASIWTKYAGVQVRVEPMPTIKQWGPLMEAGQVDMAMENTVTGGGAYRASEFFKVGDKKLTFYRMVAAGNQTLMGWWTRPDTGIKSFQDFVGKRIVVNTPPGAPDTAAIAKYMVDEYLKLAGKYRRLEIGSPAECTRALIEGRIDAYQFVAGPHIEELRRSVGVQGIPVPIDAAEYMSKKVPGQYPSVVPKGMYGLEEDLPCIAWRGALYANVKLDPDLVYKLLDALYSHLDEFHAVHPLAKQYVLANATKSPTVPFHDGAIKFYKDKGIWTGELDKIQESNLADGK
ncbi:MAG: TAXI family TRAP transporter solute-binding subunit [Pseudomonadota bacterium]